METTLTEPEYYTPIELSIKLNIKLKTITKWTQERRIPGQIKCGDRWRYRRSDVDKALLLTGNFLVPKEKPVLQRKVLTGRTVKKQ